MGGAARVQVGNETHARGKVISYCPSSMQFLLLYADGSSDGVSIDEISDHVPLLRQMPRKKGSSQNLPPVAIEDSLEPPAKRAKSSVQVKKENTPEVARACAPANVSTIATSFVKDTLWGLTTVLDVDDETRKTLLSSLGNRAVQPRAALARYAKEGGLDAVSKTLQKWACGASDGGSEECGDNPSKSAPTKAKPVVRPATTSSTASLRSRSPCERHLREPLSGKYEGIFSPKPSRLKEPKTPSKDSHVSKAPKVVPSQTPDLADLTGDSEEEDVEAADAFPARRHLRFGFNSTVRFDMRKPVDDFRLHVRKMERKRTKLPKQIPEVWKSAMKS